MLTNTHSKLELVDIIVTYKIVSFKCQRNSCTEKEPSKESSLISETSSFWTVSSDHK